MRRSVIRICTSCGAEFTGRVVEESNGITENLKKKKTVRDMWRAVSSRDKCGNVWKA